MKHFDKKQIEKIKSDTKEALKEFGHINLDHITSEYLSQDFKVLEPRTPPAGPYSGNQIYVTNIGAQPYWGFMSDGSGTVGCAISNPWTLPQSDWNASPNGSCPINGVTTQYVFTHK